MFHNYQIKKLLYYYKLLYVFYPTPYAVVNVFTNLNRFTEFKKNNFKFHGLWSLDPIYLEYMKQDFNPILHNIFYMKIIHSLWKGTSTIAYNASYFPDTALYGKVDKLDFDNEARDLVHPGYLSNKTNADVLHSKLLDKARNKGV